MRTGLKDSEMSEEDFLEVKQGEIDEAKAKSIIEEAFNSIKELNVGVEIETYNCMRLNSNTFSYYKKHSDRLVKKVLSKFIWK